MFNSKEEAKKWICNLLDMKNRKRGIELRK